MYIGNIISNLLREYFISSLDNYLLACIDMAFIVAAPRLDGLVRRLGSNNCAQVQRCGQVVTRICPSSLAKSHPYGNGGIDTTVDYSKYDPGRIEAEVAEAKALLSHMQEMEVMSDWSIVMSSDVIQWNNNLFNASKEHGYDWNLEGLVVVRMSERTARRAIDDSMTKLWVIFLAEDELVTFSMPSKPLEKMLLTFEGEDEAQRFVGFLKAEGREASTVEQNISRLKAICADAKVRFGLVPAKTLVSPSQFSMML